MNRNLPHVDQNVEDFINTCVSNLDTFDNDTLDYTITSAEVSKATRLLKNGKSPGMDGIIRSEMLKEGISKLAQPLGNLYLMSFSKTVNFLQHGDSVA